MAILAHRGITAVARDNSSVAIEEVRQAALAGIPLGIELDVRGTLVLSHEPTLSSDELITLTGALAMVTPIEVVNLEIKTAESVEGTIDALRIHCDTTGQPKEQFIVSTFLPAVVRQLKKDAPDFKIGCLIDRYFPLIDNGASAAVVDRLASNDHELDPITEWVLRVFDWTGADCLHAQWTHACPRLFEEIARRNKRLSFWTVNDLGLINALVARPETDHIVTDFPHLLFDELRLETAHRKASS